MEIRDIYTKVKIWFEQLFSGKKSRPKIPRKKLQIQFRHAKTQFTEQVQNLEQVLSSSDLAPSTIRLGNQLLQEVQRFQEIHIIRINQERLNNIAQPLVHPVDFSLWVIYQMHSYTEQIFHFIKTMEVVEL